MVSEEINKQIEKAIVVLKQGGVVVFPTETAYGLAVDSTNPKAIARVCALKCRIKEKTLPLIAANRAMVEQFAGIPRGLMSIANKYWPGPLTLILPTLGDKLAPGIEKNGEIAIRVSSHPIAQRLSHEIGHPIVSTSANKSGSPVCYSVEEVKAQFVGQDEPDLYIDVGPLSPEPPSTIVGLDDYGYPEVLRQGSIQIVV